jgi:hypothetical protein
MSALTLPEHEKWVRQDPADRTVWHWHYEMPGPRGWPIYSKSGRAPNGVDAAEAADATQAEAERQLLEYLKMLGVVPR